ncbi:MAG: FecR domain-containing protein [Rhodanobacter sp.]
MKLTTYDVIDELSLAEASAWLTRLQDSGRTPAVEAAFKEWLSASPVNARAFTRVNDVWELLPGAVAPAHPPRAAARRRARRIPWVVVPACVVLALLVVGVVRMLPPAKQTYQTAVGAQRTIDLDDHTRVTLNTDTRMIVDYSENERRVVLERGEALFHVVHNPQRPFVVQTGKAQVVDLGTVFDVSHYSRSIAVTLLEGTVWVGSQPTAQGAAVPSTVLTPGDRLTIQADGAHVLDRPDVDQALAWQHGQVHFDDITLADAVAELSHYGGPPIRIADPALATLRVSGVFSAHDPVELASAVASLHDLHLRHAGRTIVLER